MGWQTFGMLATDIVDRQPLEDLGQEIRRRREALGWTLSDLAHRAHLGANYLGSIENGQRDPGTLSLLKIASGLNCHPGDLFGIGGLDIGKLSAAAVEGAVLLDQLKPAARRSILDILERLTEVT